MTISILTLSVSFLFVFMGYIINHFAETQTFLQGWDIGCFIVAVVIAVCAVCELVYSIARLLCALHRRGKHGHRRGGKRHK